MRQEGERNTLFIAEARVPEMTRRKQAIFQFNRSLTLGLFRALPRILCSAERAMLVGPGASACAISLAAGKFAESSAVCMLGLTWCKSASWGLQRRSLTPGDLFQESWNQRFVM
jgi:hypothetical protein